MSTDDFSKLKLKGIIEWSFEKRPFCNAFTGCGRKRALRSQAKSEASVALSDLIEINSEPAVGDAKRQIICQEKILEALKEVYKEILIQNNKDKVI